MGPPDPTNVVGVDHADAPPVGLVDVSTSPNKSTATHNDDDAHDTSVRGSPSPIFHWSRPRRLAARRHVSTFPFSSTATHSEMDGQETAFKLGLFTPVVSIVTGADQAERPPVGLVDVSTFPAPSTATHDDFDGHDTPFSAFVPSTFTIDHDNGVAAAAGAGDASTVPNAPATNASTDSHAPLHARTSNMPSPPIPWTRPTACLPRAA